MEKKLRIRLASAILLSGGLGGTACDGPESCGMSEDAWDVSGFAHERQCLRPGGFSNEQYGQTTIRKA